MWHFLCAALLAWCLLLPASLQARGGQQPSWLPSPVPLLSPPLEALPPLPAGVLLFAEENDESQKLLQMLQAAHRSSVQAIRSLSCRFSSQGDNYSQGHFDERGEYWRSLAGTRCRSGPTWKERRRTSAGSSERWPPSPRHTTGRFRRARC